jgi:ABC-2 type transport system ATP-binding protein
MIIETINLKKVFRLKKAVDNISFSIKRGSIFGFIGPNGAGKSTTLNILTGIAEPTSGSIKLFGEHFKSSSIGLKKKMGVMPELPALFSYLKVKEQIYFSGRIYGLDRSTLDYRMNELLMQFNLTKDQNKFVYELSAGMKKKLSFICSIIHDPDLIFLDEPFENIDPISLTIVQDLIRQLASNGRTVFVTSHNLLLIEKLCTDIAIINEGKILIQGATKDILKELKRKSRSKSDQSLLEKLFMEIISPGRKTNSLPWLARRCV